MSDDFMGAAIRGQLAKFAQNRFAKHAPVSKVLRSPYKDSTQIGVVAKGEIPFSTTAVSNGITITGRTRVYKSFKPNKAVVNESVVLVVNDNGNKSYLPLSVPLPSNVILVGAFSGADNCFPNAPTPETGINCATFSNNALGVGISWPTINGGIDFTANFFVRAPGLNQMIAGLPSSLFVGTPEAVQITIEMTLLGPSLR